MKPVLPPRLRLRAPASEKRVPPDLDVLAAALRLDTASRCVLEGVAGHQTAVAAHVVDAAARAAAAAACKGRSATV